LLAIEEVTLSEEQRNSQADTASLPVWKDVLQRIFRRRGWFSALLLPVLAVFTALVIGAVIIAVSSPEVIQAWKTIAQTPRETLSLTFGTVREAYTALFEGSFGNPKTIAAAFVEYRTTGEVRPVLDALRPLSESLVITTPYIFAGLAVALGFRGGLFNIGAEGQLFVGGLASVYVGYTFTELPPLVHLPLSLAAGVLAGALWGAIPGFLKARTGAHEVINTIMMNYIAFRLTDHLLSGPMARPDGLPITPEIATSAYIPLILEKPVRLHYGFFIALIVAGFVYWFLWKTTRGFEIRMVGANPHAARYAGVRIAGTTVLTMALSGALAGWAGTNQVLGVDHRMVRAFSTGYGFDAIALALLGNSHPVGVVLASLLFGFLRGGAARMQSIASVPVEIIRIIQGLVIVFVAAPEIIRGIYRIKAIRKEEAAVTRGWSA
jgi:simple sugar transport system permease protein